MVAADDGVKPQTVEAIRHAKAAEVPIIVAVNKIDREEADPDRVKQELSNHEIIPEEWGGDTLVNNVSALTGEGVPELLESVLLQAEVADLKARANGPATGLVVEARLDKDAAPWPQCSCRKAPWRRGDVILAGRESGRVRVLLDETGRPVDTAGPSTTRGNSRARRCAGSRRRPGRGGRRAQGAGSGAASSGQVQGGTAGAAAKAKLESMFKDMEEGETLTLNLVVKADVHGSVEALTDALEKLSTNSVKVKVVHGMVGGINESMSTWPLPPAPSSSPSTSAPMPPPASSLNPKTWMFATTT